MRTAFINLPVADLQSQLLPSRRSRFSYNSKFSDDSGACIIVSETIYVMLATLLDFVLHTQGCSYEQGREVLLNLKCESR
jgi:predicted lactoylglutathione lyase